MMNPQTYEALAFDEDGTTMSSLLDNPDGITDAADYGKEPDLSFFANRQDAPPPAAVSSSSSSSSGFNSGGGGGLFGRGGGGGGFGRNFGNGRREDEYDPRTAREGTAISGAPSGGFLDWFAPPPSRNMGSVPPDAGGGVGGVGGVGVGFVASFRRKADEWKKEREERSRRIGNVDMLWSGQETVLDRLFKGPSDDLNALILREDWTLAAQSCKLRPRQAMRWSRRTDFFMGRYGSDVLPLHSACALQPPASLIQTLVIAYPKAVKERESSFGRLPLHVACRSGADAEVVRALVAYHPEAAATRDKLDRVPLHYALKNGSDANVIDALLDFYPDCVKCKDHRGWLPIHVACCSGSDVIVVKKLLEYYPDGRTAKTTKGTDAVACVAMCVKTDWDKDAILELLTPDTAVDLDVEPMEDDDDDDDDEKKEGEEKTADDPTSSSSSTDLLGLGGVDNGSAKETTPATAINKANHHADNANNDSKSLDLFQTSNDEEKNNNDKATDTISMMESDSASSTGKNEDDKRDTTMTTTTAAKKVSPDDLLNLSSTNSNGNTTIMAQTNETISAPIMAVTETESSDLLSMNQSTTDNNNNHGLDMNATATDGDPNNDDLIGLKKNNDDSSNFLLAPPPSSSTSTTTTTVHENVVSKTKQEEEDDFFNTQQNSHISLLG